MTLLETTDYPDDTDWELSSGVCNRDEQRTCKVMPGFST